MLIIWGWKAVCRTLATGTFACPSCGADRPYSHVEARRWFTFFFIPAIPLKRLGEYVECGTCKGTFQTAVLSQPTAEALGEALLLAVRQGLVAVLWPDPTPAARAEALAMVSSFAGREWQHADLDGDLRHLPTTDLSQRLATLAPVLSEQGKEHLVGGFTRAAATGGILPPDRRAVIERLAAEIGMTPAHARGVIAEVTERV